MGSASMMGFVDINEYYLFPTFSCFCPLWQDYPSYSRSHTKPATVDMQCDRSQGAILVSATMKNHDQRQRENVTFGVDKIKFYFISK